MKAIVRDTYRAPELLEFAEIDPPGDDAPGPGEVLVNVRAAGVDQGTWHLVTGLPHLIRAAGFGLRRPRQRIPGLDLAGTVERVGAGVTRFRPGDEVFGSGSGTFAEQAVARQEHLALKPLNVTFVQAAGVPGSACAALQGLRDRGRLRAGQTVLVIGAGGGVGSFAVQLAKALGAHVTGVCSTGKVDLVRTLGADEVIDYTTDEVLGRGVRYDLVLDTGGGRPLGALRGIVAARGTLVIVGAEGGGRIVQGADRQVRAALLSPFVAQRLCGLVSTTRADDLRTLRDLIEAGLVVTPVDRTFPLQEAAAAIRHLREGHPAGKVVITI